MRTMEGPVGEDEGEDFGALVGLVCAGAAAASKNRKTAKRDTPLLERNLRMNADLILIKSKKRYGAIVHPMQVKDTGRPETSYGNIDPRLDKIIVVFARGGRTIDRIEIAEVLVAARDTHRAAAEETLLKGGRNLGGRVILV